MPSHVEIAIDLRHHSFASRMLEIRGAHQLIYRRQRVNPLHKQMKILVSQVRKYAQVDQSLRIKGEPRLGRILLAF